MFRKKAVKKKLFVVLLSFVVTLSFVFQPNSNEVYAQNNTVNSERWMTTSGEYDFPISREKGNWDQVCTYNEKVNATIIPEDVLKQITTENLMKLLLDYPLIFDINIYDTKKQGYDMLKKQFNGIDEFLSRSDAADCQTANYGRRFRQIIFGELSGLMAISYRRMQDDSGDTTDFQRRPERDSRPYFSRGISSFEIRPRKSRSLVFSDGSVSPGSDCLPQLGSSLCRYIFSVVGHRL